MIIKMTAAFERAAKKLHRNQIKLLEDAIDQIAENPELGDMKKGDLGGVRVYKFRIHNQLVLLAYRHEDDNKVITLLSLGSHENFYRDLKKSN